MVFAALRPHVHGRGLAHSFGRRSSLPSSTSLAGATQTSTVFIPPAKPVKALASFVTLFGVVIIIFVVWRIGVWRRRKRLAESIRRRGEKALHLDIENGYSEKVLVVPPPGEGTVWVPMIKPFRPTETISVPQTAASKTSRSKQLWENIGKISSESSPPPAYFIANNTTERYTPDSTPPSTAVIDVKPAAAPQPLIPMPPIPPSFTAAPASPPLSPRSSSFSNKSWSPGSRRMSKGKRIPRLMSVTDTFVPSLRDELPVKIGEVVRLLEEYEDEWCLVQRVGRPDAPKGVVPRFCLEERPEVVPPPGRRVSRPSHHKLPIPPQGDGRSPSVLTVADLPLRTPKHF